MICKTGLTHQEQLNHDLQTWKQVLEMSGGKLALEKCNFYLAKWDFKPCGRPIIRDNEEVEVSISGESENTRIKHISITEYHKSLGYLISIAKPQEVQQYKLTEINSKFEQYLTENSLRHREVVELYRSIYIPSMKYTLPVSVLNKKRMEEITKKTKRLFLNRQGISNSTSLSVVYGSKKWGHLGMFDLYQEQGFMNLQSFVNIWYRTDQMGQMMRITFEEWMYHIGIGENPFQTLKWTFEYDESVWIKRIYEVCKYNEIKLDFQCQEIPLLRENDSYIMEKALQFSFNAFQLRCINFCRLYLGAITMADISEESGKRIETQAYDHRRAKPLETKHTNMVQQPKPTSTAWKIWKQFIHKLLRHRQTTWKRTLGRWVVPSDEIRRLYTYYRTETELFKREKGKIKKWNIIAGSTFMSKQFQSYNTEKIPRSAIPCVISLTENIYTEYQQVVVEESQEKEARWIAEEIIAVTDASVIEGKGTWAYFIADINGNIMEEMSDNIREHPISSF